MLRALIRLCVERRIAVLVVTLLIAAYGVKSYLDTPIEAFPDVTNYQVNVIAQLPGLAPEEIERQITIPLERELNGLPEMTLMRSESLFGLSLIFLVFSDDADVFKARTRVIERLASANLPEGVDVSLAPEATPLGEVYQFRLTSDRHSLMDLRSELEWNVRKVLRQVQGVADVVPSGGFLEEVHVEVEPDRLLAHGLTIGDVTAALEGSNRNVGGGFLVHGDQELTIRGIGYVTNAEDLRDVVVTSEGGIPITVGDVARLVVSHTPRRGSVGYNHDRDAVEGFALLRRGENPSIVLDGIHAKVAELNQKILPEGMKLEVFYDRSELVERTLSTVQHNLLHGALLVVGVVWLMLRSLRCSLVVASIIPLALLTAFIGLRFIGLPANLISMGAIDFGILVDGAVVLVENVMHEAQLKKPSSKGELIGLVFHAALDVAKPTFFAMAIIIAALVPVFTLEGVEGRIFNPLSMTYSFALAGALVFALTAIPALCAIVLRPKDVSGGEPEVLAGLRERYRKAVAWTVGHKGLVLSSGLALLALGAWTGTRVGTEFLPELDEGDFVIFVEMPASISLARGQDILVEVRRRVLAFPEVAEVLSEHGRPEDGTDNEGVNMSETFVRLAPPERWRPGWDKERVIQELRASLAEIPGVSFNFSQPIKDNVEEAVSGVRGKVVLKIFGTELQEMRQTLERAILAIQKVPGVVDLSLYRDADIPQLQVLLDRPALARAGISVDAAQDVVETALDGRVVTEFWKGERPVPVRVLFPASERSDESKIGDIRVRTAGGDQVPLRELARIEKAVGRANIVREANSRVMALKFNVEGRDMGSVVNEAIEVVEREVKVPDGNFLVWTGEFENQQRAMKRLSMIVPLSFLGVFLLLYMALGSGRSATAVLATVPFAMTGGLFALKLSGIPLSVSAAVGLITLLGQVCLVSLLVVAAVDGQRRNGAEKLCALVDGASGRLRAVLMTALLAMLGLTPMALATGAGSEIQRPFAVVVIGGLVTALPVTLFILPVLYDLIVRKVPVPALERAEVEA
jgi:cobalt-zinc-cadmium resistance protein CzcA